MNSMGLGFTFSVRDLASSAMMRLERAYTSLDDRVGLGGKTMASSFKVLGLGLGVLTAGVAGVGGAFALADMAGAFEKSIAAVGAISNASAKELGQLREAALDAGIKTQFSPTEATVGLRELAAAGFNAQESIALLIPVLDLAAGSFGELTPETAAGLAAQSMKAFGLETGQASLAVDQMLQATNLFALQAKDLPLALGTAARGAGVLHQKLEETLVALGLVKNVIPSVERASTAVAVAMERMVKPQTQAALKGLGVAVTDAQGNFRPFLDVLGEMAPALDKMTMAKRSAFLLKTFGGEALGGISAILTQVTNGIRTETGETLKGGAALKYLREQMEKAGGTAAAFRDKLLNTFAGQKQLLRGSIETLGILLGEPFAQVLKPVVGAAADALNALLKVLRSMPMSVKRAFGTFFAGAAVVTTLVGAVVTAVTAIALLGGVLKIAAVVLGVMVALILPAVLAVGMLAAVVAGFTIAFNRNLGGIADVAARAGQQVRLFFEGMAQLIEQGGFSGAVRDELNDAGNLSLKQFVITVWAVLYRLGRLWDGFVTGFTDAIEAAEGIFEELSAAFRDLGESLGEVFGDLSDGAASLPSERFRAFGQEVGLVVGRIVDIVAVALGFVVRFGAGLLSGMRSVWEEVEPVFSELGQALGEFADALLNLMGLDRQGGSVAERATLAFRALGSVVGRGLVRVLGWAAAALTDFIQTVTAVLRIIIALRDGFRALVAWITEVAAVVSGIFSSAFAAASEWLQETFGPIFDPILERISSIGTRVMGVLRTAVDGLKAFLQPVWEFFSHAGEHVMAGLTKLRDFIIRMARALPAGLLPPGLGAIAAWPLSTEKPEPTDADEATAAAAERAAAASSAVPAAAEAGARADQTAALQAALAAAAAASPAPGPPQTILLQVDGETLARVVNDANRNAAGRSFAPVPSF
jgi:TP901 family phage tail tape measure protein